ncbi:MAG TPA: glycosyltransferase [Opitutaceae bacterium]|nr:glycosyltransferase [Opitutaceae bacterium]
MKILLTADPTLPVPPAGYGGIERIVDALARHFRSRGHTVGLVAHRDSTCAADALFAWPAGGRSAGALRNAVALLRAARRFRPDVLHSFSRLGYLLPLLASALPKVMSYQRHTGGRQIAWASRLAGRSLRFTGCSEFICAMGRLSGGQWRAVPNFVEIDKFTFVPRVPDDAPLVFLSRIESIKGPDIAIDIARASGRRLILAGNRAEAGPEREFWERRIARRIGRDGVEWAGEVDDEKKNDLLGRAAALVVPIQWDEPFGIVFAEALAAGTPVITCARGAAPEIVEAGRTGFFVSDAAGGAEAVSRLGQIDRLACRRSAEIRFSRDVCAEKYLELYGEMKA